MLRMRRRGLLWREDQKKQAYEDGLRVVQELKDGDKWALLERRLNAARRAEAAERNRMLKRRRASTSQLPDRCLGDGRCKAMMRPTLSAAEEEEAFHGYTSALYTFMALVLALLVLLIACKFC